MHGDGYLCKKTIRGTFMLESSVFCSALCEYGFGSGKLLYRLNSESLDETTAKPMIRFCIKYS
jgi:hypothetical protein